MDDLRAYFLQAMLANGGDSEADVDALTEPGAVMLKKAGSTYKESGVLETAAAACGIECVC